MQSKMRYEQQEITPELAAVYLEKNEGNRALRTSHVAYLAHEMLDTKAKGLEPHPQPIIFGEDGMLIDGQHRLQAIIKLGMPVKMIVGYGFPREMFGWLDAGVGRSMSDRVHGYIPRHIVPVIRQHMEVRRHWSGFQSSINGITKYKATHDQYIDFYNRLEPHYKRVEEIAKRRGCYRVSAIFSALVELSIIDDGAAIDFINDMHKILNADAVPRKPHAGALRDVVENAPHINGRSTDLFFRAINVLRRYLKHYKPFDGNNKLGKPEDWYDPQLRIVEAAIKGER